MNLPPELDKHLHLLRSLLDEVESKEIYLVGGGVRDLLLNRPVLDFDFAVDSSAFQLASQLARKLRGAFVPLSQAEDEARVVINKEIILDFKGFQGSIGEDLGKRDFTINSMAVSLGEILNQNDFSIIDPFNGRADLSRGLIRKVGHLSLISDPLRILRAYRFSAQLGFVIDKSIEQEAETISLETVARERITYELMLILACPRVYSIVNRLVCNGILEQIFPFDQFWTDYSVRSHSLAVFQVLERILEQKRFCPLIREKIEEIVADSQRTALLKLSALFHDVAKPETRIVSEDGSMHFYGHDTLGARKIKWALSKLLRFSKQDSERIEQTISRHMHMHLIATAPQLTERAMRRFMKMASDTAIDIMILDLADGFATAGRTAHLERTIKKVLELAAENAKRAAFIPLVNGHDLIALGLKPGPLFKEILSELEELQWERRITSKEQGLAFVKDRLSKKEYKEIDKQDSDQLDT